MESPFVLAVETSGGVGSAALAHGLETVGQRFFTPERGHGGILLKELHALIEACGVTLEQVDVFAATAGPGSFTGVRVGLSTMAAMAWAAGKPATALGSLSVLARNLRTSGGFVAPTMDARRQEVYGALYRSDGRDLREIIPAQVAPPEAWAQSVRECVQDEAISFLGSGVAAYPEIFADSGVDHRAHAAQLGAMVASIVATRGLDHLPDARPRYIRPSQAEVNFGPAPRHLPVDNLDPNSTV